MKTPVKQDVHYDDGTVDTLYYKKPFEGIYAYALHDFECDEFFRPRNAKGEWGYNVPRSLLEDKDKLKNWNGYPEMVPFKPRNGVKLTETIQYWWAAQLVWSKYRISIFPYRNSSGHLFTVKELFHTKLTKTQQEYIANAFYKLTADQTAFTNGSGTNDRNEPTGRCFLTNTGGPDLPILWENGCGGNTYKVGYKEVNSEMEYIELVTLKASEYSTWCTWKYDDPEHRWAFTYATNETPFLVGTINTLTNKGPWKVDAMHFLDGADVIVPLISNEGHVFVKASRVEIIRELYKYRRPYVP